MEVGTVISRTARETVPLDDTLEALTLGDTRDLHPSPGAKTSTVTESPTVNLVLAPHFHQVALGAYARLLEVAEQRAC